MGRRPRGAPAGATCMARPPSPLHQHAVAHGHSHCTVSLPQPERIVRCAQGLSAHHCHVCGRRRGPEQARRGACDARCVLELAQRQLRSRQPPLPPPLPTQKGHVVRPVQGDAVLSVLDRDLCRRGRRRRETPGWAAARRDAPRPLGACASSLQQQPCQENELHTHKATPGWPRRWRSWKSRPRCSRRRCRAPGTCCGVGGRADCMQREVRKRRPRPDEGPAQQQRADDFDAWLCGRARGGLKLDRQALDACLGQRGAERVHRAISALGDCSPRRRGGSAFLF